MAKKRNGETRLPDPPPMPEARDQAEDEPQTLEQVSERLRRLEALVESNLDRLVNEPRTP